MESFQLLYRRKSILNSHTKTKTTKPPPPDQLHRKLDCSHWIWFYGTSHDRCASVDKTKPLSVRNSGAPQFSFGVFLMVYSHLCWQCSNKNRKCREHINTLGKKDKLIFLKPIFEIKTKNLLSTWKGTRVLVPRHQNSGAPTIFSVFSWLCILICGGTRTLRSFLF